MLEWVRQDVLDTFAGWTVGSDATISARQV
jgi:hypothetical protein